MAKPLVICVVGTRPDAIKSAPVIRELRRFDHQIETLVVATGQHREMLAQALAAFDLTADVDLDIMTHGQTLAQVTTRALEGLDRVLSERPAQMVLAQGDTTTTFVAGLAAFYRRVPFGHIEAGLRTPTIDDPFPEEFNRRAVALITDQHYAPTTWSAENLKKEGIPDSSILITGNTGIDAVLYTAHRSEANWLPDHQGPVILVTTHRRENWGDPQRRIAEAVRDILHAHPSAVAVVAMHRNPDVRATLSRVLGDCPQAQLIEPPDYAPFVRLMQRADLILSDSGGVQEEAPAFGKPVLVLRETTERPEGILAGVAKLVGTDRQRIVTEAHTLLSDPEAYASMARAASPYGDGRAAQRIRHAVIQRLGLDSPAELE